MPIKQLAPKVLGLPRYTKKAIAIFLDTLICILTVWIAYYLRLGYWLALKDLPFEPVLISLCLAIPIFFFFGMYRTIFRHGGRNTVTATLKAIIPYTCIYVGIITIIGIDGVPRTVGIIQPTLLFLLITLSRGLAKFLLTNTLNTSSNKKLFQSRVLIYGAGSAGRQFSDAVRASRLVKVVGYLDDDVSLQGGILNGLIVYAPKELDVLINSLDITEVLLAMPSAGRSRRNEILKNFSDKKINIRTLPDLNNFVEGRVSVSDMLELDIDDLLGRP
jgi:FlaA1/EpsC-like NDP-sugar epimerase